MRKGGEVERKRKGGQEGRNKGGEEDGERSRLGWWQPPQKRHTTKNF